jgi:4-amino-4-deoxy-L-arabinose transferase-like glycosyltransferase
MLDMLKRGARGLSYRGGWEWLLLALLAGAAPFLVYYNLEFNPRPWHDEGSYLSLAKTLANDGIYAVQTSDGYQTFGAVQSVGPTVILPIALSFKLFGAGLVQGRAVAATFALLTLVVFFGSGLKMFGRRTALLAVVFLLASPAAGFLLYGRPAFGEIPALGFLLAGWYLWAQGVGSNRRWLYAAAGLLVGAAMVTKSQYVLVGFGTLALLALLDLVYYRQGRFGSVVIVGLVAGGCVAAWWAWQVAYFGMATFQENAAKMAVLARSTTGLNLHNTIEAVKSLIGSGSGYFYFYWGFLALIYGAVLCLPRKKDSLILAFPWLFAAVWLGYYTFWIIPWARYIFPTAAITAFFVGKLCVDLASGLVSSGQDLWSEIRQFRTGHEGLSSRALISLGTLAALLTLGLLTGYQLQRTVRSDVLDKVGVEAGYFVSPPQFDSPERVAAFLNQTVPQDAVIETWERELTILTDHRYHFPDQSLLAHADTFIYNGGSRDYVLGADYFNQVRPNYVVVGWYARFNQIYDLDFLAQHGKLIGSIGDGEWRYDIYELHLQ